MEKDLINRLNWRNNLWKLSLEKLFIILFSLYTIQLRHFISIYVRIKALLTILYYWIWPACLKILGPEEIDRLEFPAGAESNFPVKKVLYRSASGVSYAGDDVTLLHEHTDHDRFNLFTGKQTLHEREESFKVIIYIRISFRFFSTDNLA